jgi:hypothetical protein
MGLRTVTIASLALFACSKTVAPPLPIPPPPVAEPARGAAGDTDVRVMATELVGAKACGMLRGGFHGLRAASDPGVVVGVLWLRGCDLETAGVHLAFHITGNGWIWVDQTKDKHGGTFVVRQYVRFSVETTIHGTLDLAYARVPHVVSLWFTPDRAPEVKFATIGDVDVDSDGVWSSVLGAIGAAVGNSPDAAAAIEATAQGTRAIGVQLANGFAVTINLCTGLTRTHLGRSAKGKMADDDVGETLRVPIALQPGGVIMIGALHATDGMTFTADPIDGAVRLRLMCAKQAELVAADVIAGRPTKSYDVLGTFDVRKRMRLAFKPTACPVVVVVTALDNAPARFGWERPRAEIARSNGGPLIACAK